MRHLAPDREIRTKLSIFLRSRWFRPPFDGAQLTSLIDHALRQMAAVGDAGSSLVLAGLPLELFVTLTDFYGYARRIPTHDPPRIDEREHRHTLRFHYQRWPGGEIVSDFEESGIPALTFAARATSSFPGAFPPTQLSEIDEVLHRDGRSWTMRDRFLAHNLGHYAAAGGEADKTSFVDGSVLNNKPFFEAIQAIRRRPALRQVDRRLVYIDPDPGRAPPPHDGRSPGFFRTLRGALSDIPRNEPVFDDLALVDMLNQKTRRLRTVVEAARPRVIELVRSVVGEALPSNTNSATIRAWREAANVAAAKESGFAYEGYVRLKLAMVVEFVAERIALRCGSGESSVEAEAIRAALDSWAYSAGTRRGATNRHFDRHGTRRRCGRRARRQDVQEARISGRPRKRGGIPEQFLRFDCGSHHRSEKPLIFSSPHSLPGNGLCRRGRAPGRFAALIPVRNPP